MLKLPHESAFLINQRLWAEASKSLQDIEHPKAVLYARSLLYRLLDAYEAEKALVLRALTIVPNWTYMLRRKQWHELPLFYRMEPRPRLFNALPQRAATHAGRALRDVCFVTAANGSYFSLLVECLEPISKLA